MKMSTVWRAYEKAAEAWDILYGVINQHDDEIEVDTKLKARYSALAARKLNQKIRFSFWLTEHIEALEK